MDKQRKYKLLLDLMTRLYEEEFQRNNNIDKKIYSFIALSGVMITIQSTLFPLITKSIFLIKLLFFISLIAYMMPIILLIKVIINENYQLAPEPDALIEFGKDDNKKESYIIENTLISFQKAIKDNACIMYNKIRKIKLSIECLICGIVLTIIYLFCYLIL